ncbi:MAG: hypothetical protein CMO08_05075 [Thalassospira sp.]|nr:hypothetical protein [Thalassospira sp.]
MAKTTKPKTTDDIKTFDFTAKDAWKRPFRNAKKLLWGEGGKSILGLLTMALTARALGVEDFGALAIITTTLAILTQFVTFSSWQLVLRYGADAIKEGNSHAYRHIVGFALGLEVLASIVGACLLMNFDFLVVKFFNLPDEVTHLLPWMGGLLVFTSISGIADGTLRLTDRFNAISTLNVAPKALKLLLVIYLFMNGYGLNAFILIMFISSGFSCLLRLTVAAYYMQEDIKKLDAEAKEKVVKPWQKGKLFSPQQGAWKFAFGLYTDSCLGMGTQQLGTLFLGALMGPVGAGFYRIAEKISTAVASPVNKLMLPAVFTDMAWLNSTKDYAATRRMVFKLGGDMGGAALVALIVLVFIGKPLITIVAGADYTHAYGTMLILVLNIVMWSTTFTLYPLIMTSGQVRYIVYGRSVMFITYVGLMFPLIQRYEIEGAAWAAVISSGIATVISAYGAYKYAGLGLEKPKKA